MRRPRFIAPATIVLSIVALAAPSATSAFSPGSTERLSISSAGYAWPGGLADAGPNAAAFAFREWVRGHPVVVVRTTTDGGQSWATRVRLSPTTARDASRVSLASDGPAVDAVWAQGKDCMAGPCRLVYAQSTDGGATFGAARAMSSGGIAGMSSAVRSGTTVALAWTDWTTGSVLVRVSQDGGATFGAATRVGTTALKPFGTKHRDSLVDLALGGGVIDVAWAGSATAVRLRRSLDGGQTWQPTQTLSTSVFAVSGVSIDAGPDDALVSFSVLVAKQVRLVTRHSGDDGLGWSAPVRVEASTLPFSGFPIVVRQPDGVYLLLHQQCATTACGAQRLALRRSTDGGATWAMSTTLGAAWAMLPAGIALAGGGIVGYTRLTDKGATQQVYARGIVDLPAPTSAGHRAR